MTVKRRRRAPAVEAPRRPVPSRGALWPRIARHLEGWQLGVVAVFLALSAALVAVPKPVDATDIPEPRVDAVALRRIHAVDATQAELARRALDPDAKALGSAIRAYGRADAADDAPAVVDARARAVDAFRAALPTVPEDVLRLRAYQLETFVSEVRGWEISGVETQALRELGGAFVLALRRSGWVDESPGRRRILLDVDALAALFKKRWNEVVGATGAPFDLSVDEQRALLRFLLKHPPETAQPSGESSAARADPKEAKAREELARAYAEQYRLKKIDELAALDPGYEADLARGVVNYRMGRYPAAAESFRRHLERRPDGPFTLRAQNYLRAALGRARDEDL